MSTSRHPVALRLERHVGGPTRLLATVMALPLVDGIFPALVIAGALTVPFGILETGLLIFGGSATMAVVLAEMQGTPREKAASVLLLGAVLIPLAMVEAALAQTIESFLETAVFHRFAGLVILAVAAKTVSAEIGEYLPSPGAIIGLGLLASVRPSEFEFVVTPDPALLAAAGAAAAVGVGFALAVALAGDHLRGRVDLDRFRFGSAVALGMLALSVLGLLPTDKPVALGVLCVTALFSYDPSGSSDPDGSTDDDGSGDAPAGVSEPAVSVGATGAAADGGGRAAETTVGGVTSLAVNGSAGDPGLAAAAGPTPAGDGAGASVADGGDEPSGVAAADPESTPADAASPEDGADSASDDDDPGESREPWL